VWNTSLVFGPDGERVSRYDKIHLFRFQRGSESYDEARTIGAGSDPVALRLAGLHIGLSVCYDLRFPELYRAMGRTEPLDLIVVPAAFTYTTGKAHWELLLRTRAVENQCYVLAAAQGGVHDNGRRTWGHSMLIDPWGEVLDVLSEGPGLVTGTIDPARLRQVRTDLPALEHRVL
jgi:deaminated glutathione amidase